MAKYLAQQDDGRKIWICILFLHLRKQLRCTRELFWVDRQKISFFLDETLIF